MRDDGSSQVCVIDKERYLSLIQRQPLLALKLIQLLSHEVGMHHDQLDQFAFKTGRERLAGLLLEMGQRFGRPGNDGIPIGIALKREEIAEMAGITAETAIRMLGAMRDERSSPSKGGRLRCSTPTGWRESRASPAIK